MQIVVDISEEDYERLKEYKKAPFDSLTSRAYEAIANGKPLSKGHGDLIDKSDLVTTTDIRADGSEFTYVSYSEIDNVPTIIEAESEVKE